MIILNGYFKGKDIRIELRDSSQCSVLQYLLRDGLDLISAMNCPSSCIYKSKSDNNCHAILMIGSSYD